ncbi:MAG TPA: energy transducer TonB [Chitinophagales bacterium]|nr:energy transducer TonB [Chitinophagales bacterium]
MRTIPTGFKQVSDLNEIIFANRNKLYGAYELRKHYNDRLLKAFLIATSSLLIFLLISLALHRKPPQINSDPFPTSFDTLQIFTVEKKKVETMHQDHTRPDLPATLIVNDTALEHPEKHDSVTAEAVGNNSALHGDTSSSGDNIRKQGFASDSLPSGNTIDSFRAIADVMPSFPGGDRAFTRYIQRHFSCDGSSATGRNNGGKLILRFVIMRDGSLTRVEVLRNDVGIDCANEAKNVLLKSPHWNPGLNNNHAVNVQMVLPITIVSE